MNWSKPLKVGKKSSVEISVQKINDYYKIKLNDKTFHVVNHDFWPRLPNWEPETLKFFSKNLINNTDYLDIGGWIGPTALFATALGARKVKVVEPNPLNFLHLLTNQINNDLLQKWSLVNACISDNRNPAIIGPIEGILNASSATNIRDEGQSGAEVISLKISDLIQKNENFSLIKIDTEGAEQYFINDLTSFSCFNAAVWLSLHPPVISQKVEFLEQLLNLRNYFYFVDCDNCEIQSEQLSLQILSDVGKPAWGTFWGNFFEIGLLPKNFFTSDGERR